MISIVAKNIVKPDQIEAFRTLARELIAATRKEAGCLAYALNQDVKEPTHLTFIERWKDQAAVDAHLKSAHFTRIVPQLGPFLAAPGEMHLYHEID